MNMGGHLFPLYSLSSRSRSSVFKSLAGWHYRPNFQYTRVVKKGEDNADIEERAPSTAEEFERVAEEKLKEAEQSVASQTADKTYDRTEEAASGDSSADSVKNRYEQHEPGADYKRRPHDD